MAKRPKTIKEIQAGKRRDEDDEEIMISNCSKQLISIHLDAPPDVDFYIGAQDYRLRPGQSFKFKKSRLRMPQVDRLRKQGFIRTV
jgi:hypothetical protein